MSLLFNTPRTERLFVQVQSAFGTINNSGGTWAASGAQLLRVNDGSSTLMAVTPLTPQDWKTGTRSSLPGIMGRKSGSWSLNNIPIVPSGTAGNAPDVDALLQSIFWQAPANTVGVKMTYTFSDETPIPITILKFSHAQTTLTQKVICNAICDNASFTFNGNTFEGSFSGTAFYGLDNDNFANEDTIGKSGLTAFPLEPSTPAIHGSIIPGFLGQVAYATGTTVPTFGSNPLDPTTAPVIGMSTSIRTGNVLYNDGIYYGYPIGTGGGGRLVDLTLDFMDTDSSALIAIKNAAKTKTVLNFAVQISSTQAGAAGYTFTFYFMQVQLNIPTMADDTARIKTGFGASPAHATAQANVDDFSMVAS